MGTYKAHGRHIIDNRPKRHPSDKKIKEEVCSTLEQSHNINCSHIEVSVHQGIVTLRGTVEEPPTKKQIEGWIEFVPGVNEVHNELNIKRAHVSKNKGRPRTHH